MYKVDVYVEPHYPLSRKQLILPCVRTLEKMNVKGRAEAAISVIGDRKMKKMNREFRGIDAPTDVLAFPYTLDNSRPADFINPPDQKNLNLGELLISYPQLLDRAAKENMLVDDMANLLVVHGTMHLLGYDHEKPEEARDMEKLEDEILDSLSPKKVVEIIK
ncbi:MAG: rRNA maturation RNase YbeY [Candidatus Woykebacteria bacterium]